MASSLTDVQSFIQALVRAYGGHLTPATLRALSTWQRMEGGSTNNPDTYNFLNTTQRLPGSHGTGNVDGVQAYNSFQQGLQATIQTLNNGRYPAIVAALRTGNWAPTAELAHDLRTWSGGGYSSILGAANGSAPPTYSPGGVQSPAGGLGTLPPQQTSPALAAQAQRQTQALTALRALLAQAPGRLAPVVPNFAPLTTPAVAPAPVAAFTSPLLGTSFGNPLASLTRA